ncbi:hypothetical protein CEXT_696331 [Caerostris extrusa]|uniref:Uncharacterized protein n=1 Tax=Caerostris extrusa TaxID=172846 RepID=A0AAV4YC32_CAEEX|nr:hypothetical protein CEXT_696331 [Caerostris extrusa]
MPNAGDECCHLSESDGEKFSKSFLRRLPSVIVAGVFIISILLHRSLPPTHFHCPLALLAQISNYSNCSSVTNRMRARIYIGRLDD